MPRFFKMFLVLLVLTPALARWRCRSRWRARCATPKSRGEREHRGAGGRAHAALARAERRCPANPASVMKLVTTYAALELLGPAYAGRPRSTADGDDLVAARATAIPKLNYESFWLLLRDLRGRGLREIRGDIVLDRSYFAPRRRRAASTTSCSGPTTSRPTRCSSTSSRCASSSCRRPSAARCACSSSRRCPASSWSTRCGCAERRLPRRARLPRPDAGRRSSRSRRAPRSPGSTRLSCGERDLNVALHQPEDYVAGMIRAALDRDRRQLARQRARRRWFRPARKLLYTHESEPLAEIVRDINKFSNNVMARQLYLTLARRARRRARRSPRAAARAIAHWLAYEGHQGARARDGERLGPVAHRAHRAPRAWSRCCRRPGAAR